MRIVYHHRTLGDGAEGVHIAEMIDAFNRLGHKVALVCPKIARRKPGLSSFSNRKDKRVISHLKKHAKQIAELAYNLISYYRVRREIKKFKPDFIYERYSAYNIGGILAASQLKTPVILEVNRTYIGRFKADFPVLFPRLLKTLERYCLQKPDRIAVVSNALRHDIAERITNPEKIILTPNAVNRHDIESFKHGDFRTEVRKSHGMSDRVVVGFVGSLRVWHGIKMLAEVMPDLLSSDPSLHFLIVGDGECMSLLREVQESHPHGDRLTLTGNVPHEEVPKWVSAMDIGLMPNSNEFDSPMKMLEYMSLHCAPIGPDLETIRQLIIDRETGYLFERDNPTSFKATILEASANPSKRDQIIAAARNHVLMHHTWEHNAEACIAAIKDLTQ